MLYEYMHQPPLTPYTHQQRQLIYTFRYHLLHNPHSLTKFLRCINWNNEEQCLEAITIIRMWDAIDPHEALQLLTRNYTNIHIRSYGVQQLSSIDESSLR
uniref:Phosphatidylinositol 3-kinase VPS34-like protein n=1 Tax=Lygus hesperus TaxID=30085 RepID=A0A0A9YFM5_LYGHE